MTKRLAKSDPNHPRQELAVSEWGHVYQLGPHRVACGTPHYLPHVRDDLHAKLWVIDPLAGLRRSAHDRGERGDGDVAGGRQSPNPIYMGRAYDALDVMKSVNARGALAYVFTDFHHMPRLHGVREMLGIRSLELLAWNHGDRVLSTPTGSSDELCCVFQTGAAAAVKVPEKAVRGQATRMVPPANDRVGQLGQKPVELLISILSSCTKQGDLVADPYLGWGSTLMAAEEAGRVCVGVEANPLNLDAIIRWWQGASGKPAHNLTRDESFDERAQQLQSRA
jgi:hypothetical protein